MSTWRQRSDYWILDVDNARYEAYVNSRGEYEVWYLKQPHYRCLRRGFATLNDLKKWVDGFIKLHKDLKDDAVVNPDV